MQRRIYNPVEHGGASLQKSQESFIIDAHLGSKYASDRRFTVEKVNRMSTFIWYGQSWLQKFFIAFLFLELIKKNVGLPHSWRRSLS